MGAPEWGALPAGLRHTLGCFPEPDGLWVCAPTPAPQAAVRGWAGARPRDPSRPLPVFCSISSSFSLSRLCLPHPCRALCTRFQETPPISSTWAPGLEQAGERQVLLKRPRELAGHRCWGCAPWPLPGQLVPGHLYRVKCDGRGRLSGFQLRETTACVLMPALGSPGQVTNPSGPQFFHL